jgi:hypothetical protein
VESRLDQTLDSLENLIKDEFADCKRAEEARDAIKSAPVESKRHVLYSYIKSWADCLSRTIETRFDDYVRVGFASLPQEEAITSGEIYRGCGSESDAIVRTRFPSVANSYSNETQEQ